MSCLEMHRPLCLPLPPRVSGGLFSVLARLFLRWIYAGNLVNLARRAPSQAWILIHHPSVTAPMELANLGIQVLDVVITEARELVAGYRTWSVGNEVRPAQANTDVLSKGRRGMIHETETVF